MNRLISGKLTHKFSTLRETNPEFCLLIFKLKLQKLKTVTSHIFYFTCEKMPVKIQRGMVSYIHALPLSSVPLSLVIVVVG
jgi:hypothetical protein